MNTRGVRRFTDSAPHYATWVRRRCLGDKFDSHMTVPFDKTQVKRLIVSTILV